ncbi:TGB3 protein [Wheat virus Q]|nr:TGB3 protein [Wheat virus Q]
MQRVDLFLIVAILALASTFCAVTVLQSQQPKQCILELNGAGMLIEGCELSPALIDSIARLSRSLIYNSHALDPEDAGFDLNKLCT